MGERAAIPRLPVSFRNVGMRRTFFTYVPLQTTVTGIIQYAVGASYCQTAPIADWASCAALYSDYRVRRIIVKLIPLQAFTVTNSGGMLVAGKFYGGDGSQISNVQTALETRGSQIINCLSPDTVTVTVTPSTSPSSDNWDRTNVGMSTITNFGVYFYATGLTASTSYFTLVAEYEVEFRNGC